MYYIINLIQRKNVCAIIESAYDLSKNSISVQFYSKEIITIILLSHELRYVTCVQN